MQLEDSIQTIPFDFIVNVLYPECLTFDETGILPENAEMRKVGKAYLGSDNALDLTLVGGKIYKHIAQHLLSAKISDLLLVPENITISPRFKNQIEGTIKEKI